MPLKKNHMWNIGKVTIENQIVAAPLAGISNPVYRQMNHEFGAGLVVSEMISDKALHYQNIKTQEMCATVKQEHPVSLQLFGSDPITMAEASAYLTEHTNCDVIDINMGCPVTKIIKAHSGSWLLQNEMLASDIVKAVVENTNRPVTIKMRAGWDGQNINCVRFAQAMEKAGASAIAIHGRTRAQMYEGYSNNEYIKQVKEAVRIPVIGNGDIRSIADAKRMLQETNCDAIMIGRGLIGRPFFIQELKAALENKEYTQPSYNERIFMALDHARKLCLYQGENSGIKMMRGIAAWYIAGMPFASTYKNALSSMHSLEDMQEILFGYQKKLQEIE